MDVFIRIIFCACFSLVFVSICSAQSEEPSLAKAYYTMKHKRDTLNKDSIYTENMCLLIANKSSLFYSYDRVLQSLAVGKNLDEQSKNWTGPGLPKTKMPSNLRKISTEEFYIFQTDKKLFVKEYLIQNYLYREPLDEINWTLKTETKTIGKTACQKAIANYKGRDWVAWFAPDIPFETGPWKLHGLPGLILEAYDTKNEIRFLFNGFEKVNQEPPLKIELPKNAIKIDVAEIKKLKETMYKNSRSFFEAQIQARRGIIDSKEYAGFSFKKINNPIDLTENK